MSRSTSAGRSMAFSVVSIIVDFVRSRQLRRIAKEEGSDALAADALHFASDLVSSTLVLLGLVAAHYGFERGDALAAFGVAVFIAIAGFRLGRRTIDTLLDAAPRELAPRLRARDRRRAGRHRDRFAAPAHYRPGHRRRGDDRRCARTSRGAGGAHQIGRRRRNRRRDAARPHHAVDRAEALDDETVAERILLVGARRHIHAHHVIAQQIEGRLSIGVDIELDGAMPLGRAHAIAADFESALRDEFGADAEVETHIEPLEMHLLAAQAADSTIAGAIEAALARVAAQTRPIAQVRDVRVRQTAGGSSSTFIADLTPPYRCKTRMTRSMKSSAGPARNFRRFYASSVAPNRLTAEPAA